MTDISRELLTDEDREALINSLRLWQDEGIANPRIPLGMDLDGDGKVDSWALSPLGTLILVPTDPDQTVMVSSGEGS